MDRARPPRRRRAHRSFEVFRRFGNNPSETTDHLGQSRPTQLELSRDDDRSARRDIGEPRSVVIDGVAEDGQSCDDDYDPVDDEYHDEHHDDDGCSRDWPDVACGNSRVSERSRDDVSVHVAERSRCGAGALGRRERARRTSALPGRDDLSARRSRHLAFRDGARRTVLDHGVSRFGHADFRLVFDRGRRAELGFAVSERTATLRSGLGALVKAAVLVGGVPLALWRLWFVAALPLHLAAWAALRAPSTWAHLAVLLVAAVWAVASLRLVREISGALRRREPLDATSWSTRWAVAIAALIVLSSASSIVHSSRPSSPSPTKSAPAPMSATEQRPVKTPSASRSATVEHGECLADTAARVLGCADDWPALFRANYAEIQRDGARMLDPIHVRAGWALRVPNELEARPAASGATTSSTGRLAELALIGTGAIALCAIARRLRVLRRAGSALRRDGERRRQDAPAAHEDALLAPFADAPLVDWIDAANRLLWRAAQDGSAELDEIRLVRAGPEGIEFLLAAELPEAQWPFVARHGGKWWQLDPSLDLDELAGLADGCGRFAPALIPVGDDVLASYLVPVTRGRRLAISGEGALVDRALRSIVSALRSMPWADELAVELVGIDPPPAEEQCYQLASSSAADLVELASDAARSGSRLDSTWRREPLVVVARGALSPSDERTLDAASEVAGIISAGTRGTEVLELGVDGAVLYPYGISLSAVTPNDSQLALVEALFADARRPPEIVAIRPGPSTGVERLEAIPPRGAVEVRILRPVPDIIGLDSDPFARDAARVVELLAYLTLHGGRASIDAIAEALFPRSPAPSRSTRAENVAAAARTALGSKSASPLLVRRGRELAVDPVVTSDWRRVERALAAARLASPDAAERLATSALGLVDGPPFSGVVAGYAWARAESLDEVIAAELVDAAHRLATLSLASDDIARAKWAIGRGQVVNCESEILARDLMTALDAEGDRRGMRTAYSELERALERIGGNEPSIETRALFEALDSER